VQRAQSLRQLNHIINKTLADLPVNVFPFGSWARQEEKRTSDIDIALQPKEDIPKEKWVELRERIEESTLPYIVDLVDLSKANFVFTEKVMKEWIQWRDCTNEFNQQARR